MTRFTQQLLKSKEGDLAYVPTEIPLGYRYRSYAWDGSAGRLQLRFAAQRLQTLLFRVTRFSQTFESCREGSLRTYERSGNRVFSDGVSAWRCQRTPAGAIVKMSANGPGLKADELVGVVASGRRIR
jgi:hypothetical protein